MHRAELTSAIDRLDHVEHLAEIQSVVKVAARSVVRADGATFVLRDGDQCFYADEDAMSPLWKGQRFPLTACISGWAMLNHEAAIVPDITVDARIPLEAYRPTFVKSLVMTPFGIERSVGAIGVYWARPHHPTADEISTLAELAEATGVAIDRVGLDEAPFMPARLGDAERARSRRSAALAAYATTTS
jgi:GAF domain-containing protein